MSPLAQAQAVADYISNGSDYSEKDSAEIDKAVSSVEANLKSSDANAVADNIKTILSASSQIGEASNDQLSDLQSTIDNVSDQYNSLSEEEKNTLSQSKDLLDNAKSAVNAMSESTEIAEHTGSIDLEQTGEENSFRYINGVNISDAVSIVDQEQEAVSSNTSDTSDSGDQNDQSAITGTSAPHANLSVKNALFTENGADLIGNATETNAYTSKLPTHSGIDVSKHNGTIDWAKVKQSGIEFAIIRCGYGKNYSQQDDDKWAYNVAQCEKYGIPYGVYLYSYATTTDSIDSEVQHALRLLNGHHPTLPVYIDIEENEQFALGADTLSSFAKRFCDQISSAGYKAGLYTSSLKWETYFGGFASLPNYYHWVAQWANDCTYAQRFEAWQYSSHGAVNGVPTRVDLDIWYGTLGSTVQIPDSSDNSSGSSDDANPDIIQDGTYYIANFGNQSLVLDVADASKSNNANVQLYSLNKTGAQKFTLQYLNNGYYRITNVNSGKVLDVDGASGNNGANVQQYESNNTYAQQWKVKENNDGSLTFICRASGKVLDINGGTIRSGINIQQYISNGTVAQKFTLLSANEASDSDASDIVSDGTYYIANYRHQNLVLDVQDASVTNAANVQLYTLNKTGAQKFTLQYLNNGYYRITNVNSGKVLDVNGASGNNGANVQQYGSNNTYAQQWKVTRNSDGSFTLTCRASGKVLDINGGVLHSGSNIQQYVSNRTAAQQFVLLPVDDSSDNAKSKIVADGTYYIANSANQNLVLDVVSASKANAANVQLYTLNKTGAQRFTLKYLNNGYYSITNVNSGKVLNVNGASTKNGANVEQCDSNNTYAQQWKVTKNSDGSLTFTCRASGKVLDIYGGTIQSGTNIQQYASNGTAAQKFVLLNID
jgi:GH25 family lysozyme M1 (1,4-beta-N-acetylmuramidase)